MMLRVPALSHQARRFSATRELHASVLESFWETMDNIGVQPYGGYHWFESFHASAVSKIRQKLKRVDVVVEVRDARVPFSSYNEELEKLTTGKPRVIMFNKADLADPDANQKLVDFYNKLGVPVMLTTNKGVSTEDAKRLARVITRMRIPTFLNEYPLQAMFVGMPNVGKSACIMNLRKAFNDDLTDHRGFGLKERKRMHKNRVARSTGFLPGVTRRIGAVTVAPHKNFNSHITLIDTPGILMPRTVNIMQAQKIAMVGLSDFMHTVGRERHVEDMSKLTFELIFRNGMESAVMSHFRLPFPPPQTLKEFQGRAMLTMGILSLSAFKHLKFHSERSFNGSYYPQRMQMSEMLVNEFRKGSFGRVTLDEIPEINDENVVTAPGYIQDLYEQEKERRSEREHLLNAARELAKGKREEAATAEEAAARDAEHSTTDEAHLRVWDIKTTTVQISKGGVSGDNPSHEQKNYELHKMVKELNDSEQTLSRRKGVLSGNLTEFATSPLADRDEKNEYFREKISSKFNHRYAKQSARGRSPLNALPDEIAPRLEKLVRIKTYARPNPLNDTRSLNIMTGEMKRSKDSNPAFKDALGRIHARVKGKAFGST
eukprot:TRINITY_DN787_c1_g1_i2.p1 TRINITY_DN787_c1_g1~~TRINITY_DN787_c1_g1_i2.p1  ORF type:complete len:602 (+),score=206.17 TRINITY_DN787_c1_g1_i2:93-1898(+)